MANPFFYGYDEEDVGLIVPRPKYSVSISKNNKIISIKDDGSLDAKVGLSYDVPTHTLTLSGEKNATLADVEMPNSIQGLVSSRYSSGDTSIILTFENVDGSETEFSLDVADLVNIYKAGNGILISDENVISLKLNEANNALVLDENGLWLNLTDIDVSLSAISGAVDALADDVEELYDETSAISGAIDSIKLESEDGGYLYDLKVKDASVGSIRIPKGQILKDVQTSGTCLILFFEVDGKEKPQVEIIDMAKTIDILSATSGVQITDEVVFSIKIDEDSELYLSVSEDGLKIEGIDDIVSNVDELSATTEYIQNEIIYLSGAVSSSTEGYAKEQWVEEKLTPFNVFMSAQTVTNVEQKGLINKNIQDILDLSAYTMSLPTNEDIESALTDYATKEDVKNEINSALTDYATKEDVKNEINSALTDYDKHDVILSEIASALTPYATQEYVDDAMESAVTSAKTWVIEQDYMKNSYSGSFATKADVLSAETRANKYTDDSIADLSGSCETYADEKYDNATAYTNVEAEELMKVISASSANTIAWVKDQKYLQSAATVEDLRELSATVKSMSGTVENFYATKDDVKEAKKDAAASAKTWVEDQAYLTEYKASQTYASASTVEKLSASVDTNTSNIAKISSELSATQSSVGELETNYNTMNLSGTAHEIAQGYIGSEELNSKLSAYTLTAVTAEVQRNANKSNTSIGALTQGLTIDESSITAEYDTDMEYAKAIQKPFDEIYKIVHLLIEGYDENNPENFKGLLKSLQNKLS